VVAPYEVEDVTAAVSFSTMDEVSRDVCSELVATASDVAVL